jgi:hypothetical protein
MGEEVNQAPFGINITAGTGAVVSGPNGPW